MTSKERKAVILDLLGEKSSVSVAELSELFKLSEVSVRKQLVTLEQQGLIKRTWGGAISAQTSLAEFSHEEKETKHLAEKTAIARCAYERIADGEAVFLDSGTTTLQLAKLLAGGDKRNVLVVTNALNIALEFHKAEDMQVVLIGGQFRHRILCCTGFFTMEALKYLFFDKGFVTGNHFSLERGFTTPAIQEAEMKRKVIGVSKESFILMDFSKYGDDSLTLIAPCDEVDCVITDWRAPQSVIDQFAERGVRVVAAQRRLE